MARPSDAEIAQARGDAVEANILAREAESRARNLRKDANAKQARYDNLLLERDNMTIEDHPDYQEA